MARSGVISYFGLRLAVSGRQGRKNACTTRAFQRSIAQAEVTFPRQGKWSRQTRNAMETQVLDSGVTDWQWALVEFQPVGCCMLRPFDSTFLNIAKKVSD